MPFAEGHDHVGPAVVVQVHLAADVPGTLMGCSLRAIAQGQSVDDWRTYVVSENSWGRMIRSERLKYCVYDSGPLRESLTNMNDDPGETTNLASLPDSREPLLQHRRYLRQWIKDSNDTEAKAFAFDVSRPTTR